MGLRRALISSSSLPSREARMGETLFLPVPGVPVTPIAFSLFCAVPGVVQRRSMRSEYGFIA